MGVLISKNRPCNNVCEGKQLEKNKKGSKGTRKNDLKLAEDSKQQGPGHVLDTTNKDEPTKRRETESKTQPALDAHLPQFEPRGKGCGNSPTSQRGDWSPSKKPWLFA